MTSRHKSGLTGLSIFGAQSSSSPAICSAFSKEILSVVFFDATQHDPRSSFDPLPNGEYRAILSSSERKATKANDGYYHNLKFEIIDGPHKGRFIWERLNLENKNPKAVDIARASLSALCHAVNVMRPNDPIELQSIPLILVVKCRTNEQTKEIENTIAGYKDKDGNAPKARGAVNNPAPPTASAGNAAPWKRG